MRGITPVIAIILLLLMAVAAAGGFYFVYQGFTESGEESGSTQIEQLGEQSLAAIQIESAAGGRIYVKNVGAGDIDLSKTTVYVEERPVRVNRSSDTLAERSREVFKLTEVPGCTAEKCEVKISGAASTSKSVDLAKLLCSSDSDCYSSETCEGGICVESGEEGTACGDGTCDSGEDGENCFSDCGPRSLLVPWATPTQTDTHVYEWDGSTFAYSRNLTQTARESVFWHQEYDSQGNALAVGVDDLNGPSEGEIMWSFYDGSSWTETDNITDNDRYDIAIIGFNFNSSDEAIAVWRTADDIGWASFDGSWSPVDNITSNSGSGVRVEGWPAFAFAPGDEGMAVWASQNESGSGPKHAWVNYSFWNDAWSEPGVIASYEHDSLDHYAAAPVLGFNSTHAMAVWALQYDYVSGPNQVLQWSAWDGLSWSTAENVTDELSELQPYAVEWTGDRWLLLAENGESMPTWSEWFEWSGGWVDQGNLTEGFGGPLVTRNENGALNVVIVQGYVLDHQRLAHLHWEGTGWSGTVEMERP